MCSLCVARTFVLSPVYLSLFPLALRLTGAKCVSVLLPLAADPQSVPSSPPPLLSTLVPRVSPAPIDSYHLFFFYYPSTFIYTASCFISLFVLPRSVVFSVIYMNFIWPSLTVGGRVLVFPDFQSRRSSVGVSPSISRDVLCAPFVTLYFLSQKPSGNTCSFRSVCLECSL